MRIYQTTMPLVLDPLSTSNPEWGRIYDVIAASYGQEACVVRIEEVRQDTAGYEYRLNELNIEPESPEDRTKESLVQELFHGTKEKNVLSILKSGLLASKNVTSALGKGTYFSANIATSLLGYTDTSKSTQLSYVFFCDAIMQDLKGSRNIYVSPSDDSFKIKYLIRFFKNPPR